MGVLIKDMEKPKSCYAVIDGESEYCPFVNTDDDCVLLLKKGICEGTWEEQYSKCPLAEAAEPCEDAVSRHRLLNDLKELIAAWEKYPVMAEQIKGVEAAIGYVQTIPSAQPEKAQLSQEDATFDCVSRQVAIDAINSMFAPTPTQMDMKEDCLEIIENLPSAQPEQKWMEITPDTPEENVPVLLGIRFRDDFKYFVSMRQDYTYWTGIGRDFHGEAKWMPLPQSWAERREE